MTGAGQKKDTDNTVWMNKMKNDKSLTSSGALGGIQGGEIGSFYNTVSLGPASGAVLYTSSSLGLK